MGFLEITQTFARPYVSETETSLAKREMNVGFTHTPVSFLTAILFLSHVAIAREEGLKETADNPPR